MLVHRKDTAKGVRAGSSYWDIAQEGPSALLGSFCWRADGREGHWMWAMACLVTRWDAIMRQSGGVTAEWSSTSCVTGHCKWCCAFNSGGPSSSAHPTQDNTSCKTPPTLARGRPWRGPVCPCPGTWPHQSGWTARRPAAVHARNKCTPKKGILNVSPPFIPVLPPPPLPPVPASAVPPLPLSMASVTWGFG